MLIFRKTDLTLNNKLYRKLLQTFQLWWEYPIIMVFKDWKFMQLQLVYLLFHHFLYYSVWYCATTAKAATKGVFYFLNKDKTWSMKNSTHLLGTTTMFLLCYFTNLKRAAQAPWATLCQKLFNFSSNYRCIIVRRTRITSGMTIMRPGNLQKTLKINCWPCWASFLCFHEWKRGSRESSLMKPMPDLPVLVDGKWYIIYALL